jgi:hypothetical protein
LSTLDLATLDTPATVMMLNWAMAAIVARYAAAGPAPEPIAGQAVAEPAIEGKLPV